MAQATAKVRTMRLKLVGKPHNGRDVTYTDPETNAEVPCQIELTRTKPGETPSLENGDPLPLRPFVPDAMDHANDAGWFYDEETKEWVSRIGGQRLLIDLAQYYKRFVAPVGRRFGKTTSISFLLLADAVKTAGKYYALIISPSHDKAYEMMEHVMDMWGGKPGQKDINTGKAKPTMISRVVGGPRDQRRFIEVDAGIKPPVGEAINTGMRIYFVSGGHPHYKRIRGYPHAMHRVIVDEFAQAHPALWSVVNHMLADSDGYGLFIGTTDETEIGNDLFHTFFLWGLDQSPKRASWGCMNFPSFANPILSEKGLAEVEAGCVTEEDRLQEIYAKFLTGRGAVFQNLPRILTLPYITGDDLPPFIHRIRAEGLRALKKAQDESIKPPEAWLHSGYKKGHTYVMGADWAKDRDHTILSVIDVTTMKQALIVRFFGQNWPEQYVWAARLYQHYGCTQWHGDENTGAGQTIADFMRTRYHHGIYPHKFNVHSKAAYVTRLQTIFLERGLQLINCYEQYEEFKSYKRFTPDETKGQVLVRYGHPPGRNDDFVDVILMLSEIIAMGTVSLNRRDEPEQKWDNKDGEFTVQTRALDVDLLSDGEDYSGML
ncbi:MAG: hypothetical protein GY720_15860 [bacterium]|nr:hypothetical protein [bacterium]